MVTGVHDSVCGWSSGKTLIQTTISMFTHSTTTSLLYNKIFKFHKAWRYSALFMIINVIHNQKHELLHHLSAHMRPKVCHHTRLTVACGRSRSHHRSRMTDSRNIHCTFWPEIRRCRRTGELRWSALSPPWQSRLPGLIASKGWSAKKEWTPGEKDALF